ncbi:S49 family peptidase, partial [Vibrio cholerae]
AFASEVIRHEVEALKAAGKPVVVSMSSLAASGGYWISMSADKIVAQPTTLTGSIGIFSVITTFEKGLNNLGIYTDGVGTTPFSGQGMTTGLTQGAKEAIQLGIEHGYQRFISLVAEKRGLTLKAVDELAQGRVWTAQDAQTLGLVDQLGDFDDAVRLAANLAHLERYNLYWVEKPLTPVQQFFQDLLGQVRVSLGLDVSTLLPKSLQPLAVEWQQQTSLLNQLNDPKGQYAFCLPCQVE